MRGVDGFLLKLASSVRSGILCVCGYNFLPVDYVAL